MIDTDKYEGHTPADQWTTYKMGADKPYHAVRFGGRGLDLELKFGADAQLIADAPLLLEEVKRLRGIIDYIRDTGRMDISNGPLLSVMEKVLTTEEYLEWRNEE